MEVAGPTAAHRGQIYRIENKALLDSGFRPRQEHHLFRVLGVEKAWKERWPSAAIGFAAHSTQRNTRK